MHVILIDDDDTSRQELMEILKKRRIPIVTALDSLQQGIETIESAPDKVALAICNYRGGSVALLESFLRVTSQIPAIVLGETGAPKFIRDAKLDWLARGAEAALNRALDQLRGDGVLDTHLAPDSDFISVPISSLNPEKPPPVDFYLRLAPNRYCLRFRKEDGLDAIALDTYRRRPGTENLYARKDGLNGWLVKSSQEIDDWLERPRPDPAATRQLAEENLEVVQNVVSQLGFTPKAEELAKKTVALTLKALGTSPELGQILGQMRVHEGKYIASHSLMLAEIACALAHRLTWSSATTFLKLTTAAFVHDLNLPGNRLARMRIAAEVNEANGFTADDERAFRSHPVQAAEFSRQLRQLPADVDTIVLQHHEQPDGSGFPRGLFHHQISPLSCVFIVAEDLLDHFLEGGTDTGGSMTAFLQRNETRYAQGTFRKIYDSLKSGTPAAQA